MEYVPEGYPMKLLRHQRPSLGMAEVRAPHSRCLWASYVSSLAAMVRLQDADVHHPSARVRCE